MRTGSRPSKSFAPRPDPPMTERSRGAQPSSRWKAIRARRCPRCLEGAIYERIFEPSKSCSQCGLVFEREPGYFLGSFYVSYGIGVAVAIPTVLVAVFLKLSFLWLFPIVAFWLAVMGPLIVTYSRVIWYHFDHVVDPR